MHVRIQSWAWNIMLTAGLFIVPFFIGWSVINSVAWSTGSTQALPATTIVLLLLVWLLVGFPLTVVGGILGKNNAGTGLSLIVYFTYTHVLLVLQEALTPPAAPRTSRARFLLLQSIAQHSPKC